MQFRLTSLCQPHKRSNNSSFRQTFAILSKHFLSYRSILTADCVGWLHVVGLFSDAWMSFLVVLFVLFWYLNSYYLFAPSTFWAASLWTRLTFLMRFFASSMLANVNFLPVHAVLMWLVSAEGEWTMMLRMCLRCLQNSILAMTPFSVQQILWLLHVVIKSK